MSNIQSNLAQTLHSLLTSKNKQIFVSNPFYKKVQNPFFLLESRKNHIDDKICQMGNPTFVRYVFCT